MQDCLLELSVLNLLDENSLQGNQIAQRLAQLPRLKVKDEAVYALLGRLCREGSVSSGTAQTPAQRIYELTSAGRHQLWDLNDAWQEVSRALDRLTVKDRTFG
jgi:DNA-binding PadR family transcriptional regulator